jgi:hypothetical protein
LKAQKDQDGEQKTGIDIRLSFDLSRKDKIAVKEMIYMAAKGISIRIYASRTHAHTRNPHHRGSKKCT